MISLRARSVAPAEIQRPAAFNAPLFRSLVERLDTERRYVVLDLGAASAQTIALFSHYRCRLDIADLADGLNAINAEADPERQREIAERLLPASQVEATDLVLCWDILNYLEPGAVTALMSRIADRSRLETLVHMLIVYSEPNMPVRPGHYVPLQDQSILHIPECDDERAAPRYTPEDLSRLLPGYSMERAMLLSNGMQEFLFRLKHRGGDLTRAGPRPAPVHR